MSRQAWSSMNVLAALALVALCTLPAVAQEPAPRMGEVLKAAMIGEPPTLDMHWTTAVITQQIMWHVYETLYTYDHAFAPGSPRCSTSRKGS